MSYIIEHEEEIIDLMRSLRNTKDLKEYQETLCDVTKLVTDLYKFVEGIYSE